MVIFEDSSQVLSMAFSIIFDAKVINNKAEHDGSPFVVLKAWSGVGFIVTFFQGEGNIGY